MIKVLSVFVLTVLSTLVLGQELIRNGDFEEYNTCPITYRKGYTKYLTPGWESPTTGTPDVFNECSKTGAGVPYNWAGVSAAQSGVGYMGILIYGHKEFLKTRFTPLVQGESYVLSFYHRLSSYSTEAVDRIAVEIGHDSLSYRRSYVKQKALDSLTGKWEHVRDTIVAQGGENYLTIGNFDSDILTLNKHLFFREGQEDMLSNHAYHYIDNVSLIQLREDTIQVDKVYTFQNLLFEFDESILLPSSFVELDQLAQYLDSNKDVGVEIYGHTDESGEPDYNLNLSTRRAEAVVDYLLGKGISKDRLTFEGFGETKPLGNDDALNRRVEFKLSRR